MRPFLLAIALLALPALIAPSLAEARGKRKRAAVAKKVKAPKGKARALTADDPFLTVGPKASSTSAPPAIVAQVQSPRARATPARR
jgi:hypothetical protein